MSRDDWKRVSRSNPCPVCGRPNREHTSRWCLVTKDGTAAICPFTMEGSVRDLGPDTGYLHRFGDHDARTERQQRRDLEQLREERKRVEAAGPNFLSIQNGLRSAMGLAKVKANLSRTLGVSERSLDRLGIGHHPQRNAATFPMRNEHLRPIGIRMRDLDDGGKYAWSGSKNGLFIPTGDPTFERRTHREPLYLVEGPTDTAALLDLGLPAIGLPMAGGGGDYLIPIVRCVRHVVIIADRDENRAGQNAAKRLAERLVKDGRGHVRVLVPPPGIGDAREWKKSGGTSEVIGSMAANRKVHSARGTSTWA